MGSLIRKTTRTYRRDCEYVGSSLPECSNGSAEPHLISLPLTVWVDGIETQGSNTLYLHDEYRYRPLQDAPGIPWHDDSNYGTSNWKRGNLTTIWQAKDGVNIDIATAQYAYDIAGNLKTKIDGNGNPTQIDFNHDQTYLYARPSGVSNALGQQTSSVYDRWTGHVTQTVDANQKSTYYSYDNDPLDRLKTLQRADGSHTYYAYPSANEVVVTQDQNANGAQLRTEQYYDGLGRSTETRTFEDASHYIRTTISYDALGRVIQRTNPSRCDINQNCDSLGYPTTYVYDPLGRIISVTEQDGSSVTTAYKGTVTTVTDEAGAVKEYRYDALGRLVNVVEDPGSAHYSTTYTYDGLDSLHQVTQGAQTRTFVFDGLGRLASAANPESGTTSYTYYNTGNLYTKTDARNITTTYSYDQLNRIMSKSYSDGTPRVTYSYDSANVTNSVGRLTELSAVAVGRSTTQFTGYDSMGRISGSKQITGGRECAFGYLYDFAGNLISETYPTGRVVATSYDTANRMSQVKGTMSGQAKTYVAVNSYYPHGASYQSTYGNQTDTYEHGIQ